MSEKMDGPSVTRELFETETGVPLIAGTLNVRSAKPVMMPVTAALLQRGPHGDVVYMAAVRINGVKAWWVRHARVETGTDMDSQHVIELVSEHDLRRVLDLADGTEAEVLLGHE